jgi:NADH-quinone oxidoreductase subunit E
VSCALRGGEELLEHLCHKAGIRPGETTDDGRLTLEYAECLGGCDFAPCMLAGDDLHKNVTHENADAFLRTLE